MDNDWAELLLSLSSLRHGAGEDTSRLRAGNPRPSRNLRPEDVGTRRLADSRSGLVSRYDQERMVTSNGRTARPLTYQERVAMLTRDAGPRPRFATIHILRRGDR